MSDPKPGSNPDSEPAESHKPRVLLVEDWVGALSMALLALITFANVLARYFTSESFAWTEELSVWLMLVVTLVAASAAASRDRHIRIEILLRGGSASRRKGLQLLGEAATVLAFLMMFGLGMRLFWDDLRFEVTSPGIGVPQWWYTVWLPLLSLAVAARSMQRLVRLVRPQ
jgi:TRAP-type C4-dicarboxylate transport system permease small subunit